MTCKRILRCTWQSESGLEIECRGITVVDQRSQSTGAGGTSIVFIRLEEAAVVFRPKITLLHLNGAVHHRSPRKPMVLTSDLIAVVVREGPRVVVGKVDFEFHCISVAHVQSTDTADSHVSQWHR